MNQKKNQGNQGRGSQQAGQRDGYRSQDPNRDQGDGQRREMPGSDQSGPRHAQDPDGNRIDQDNPGTRTSQGNQDDRRTNTPERGRGIPGERNSSSSGGGISNRGLDREEEQEDVPMRGSERGSGDSER